jgi:hypothetical protein
MGSVDPTLRWAPMGFELKIHRSSSIHDIQEIRNKVYFIPSKMVPLSPVSYLAPSAVIILSTYNLNNDNFFSEIYVSLSFK